MLLRAEPEGREARPRTRFVAGHRARAARLERLPPAAGPQG